MSGAKVADVDDEATAEDKEGRKVDKSDVGAVSDSFACRAVQGSANNSPGKASKVGRLTLLLVLEQSNPLATPPKHHPPPQVKLLPLPVGHVLARPEPLHLVPLSIPSFLASLFAMTSSSTCPAERWWFLQREVRSPDGVQE